MVNINELYLLNLALDGHDIFGLPKLSKIRLSTLLGSSVYSALIKKELMVDPENFTQDGAILLKKIEQYKNARKYVKLGTVIIGIYNSEYAIALIIDMNRNRFDFKRIEYGNILEHLGPSYPFLKFENKTKLLSMEKDQISYEELKETYSLKLDNALYLSTLDMEMLREKKKDFVTNELLFHCEDVNYCYDFNLNKLRTCTTIQMQELIRKRVSI